MIRNGVNCQLVINSVDLKEFVFDLVDEISANQIEERYKKEKYFTRDEVCKQHHVDKSTLWRWAKSGYLVPVKLGGKVFYKESDIIKLMEG